MSLTTFLDYNGTPYKETVMQQATIVFDRLTEVEKMSIRAAGDSRLEYLADVNFHVDMPNLHVAERREVMVEVKALCALEWAAKSASTVFSGVTWKF